MTKKPNDKKINHVPAFYPHLKIDEKMMYETKINNSYFSYFNLIDVWLFWLSD